MTIVQYTVHAVANGLTGCSNIAMLLELYRYRGMRCQIWFLCMTLSLTYTLSQCTFDDVIICKRCII